MSFQITIDCSDPDRMARFWAAALHYELEPPPGDFATWAEYWMSIGVPEDDTGPGHDSIIDPERMRPRIWFQVVPEAKSIKNRLHFDLLVGGGRTVSSEERRARVDAEAARLTALGATERFTMDSPEIDHYFKAMSDPEGNEFDIV